MGNPSFNFFSQINRWKSSLMSHLEVCVLSCGSGNTVHYCVVAHNKHIIPSMIPHDCNLGTQEVDTEELKG